MVLMSRLVPHHASKPRIQWVDSLWQVYFKAPPLMGQIPTLSRDWVIKPVMPLLCKAYVVYCIWGFIVTHKVLTLVKLRVSQVRM